MTWENNKENKGIMPIGSRIKRKQKPKPDRHMNTSFSKAFYKEMMKVVNEQNAHLRSILNEEF